MEMNKPSLSLRAAGCAWLAAAVTALAQPFQLPTANRAIFQPGAEEKYFVGTVGKPWPSGIFGCVRSEGAKLHEGIDIRALARDKRGEPTDPVLAAADGAVVYVNPHAGLSNYGNYVVLRHAVEGVEIYSVYAHLREVRKEIQVGRALKAGDAIGTLGRTAGTSEGISRDRAHLHFELNVFLNDRFSAWFKERNPGTKNDHGAWNGHNLNGLDPREIFLAQKRDGANFSLVRFIQHETPLCRVMVRQKEFPYLKRYAPLIKHNPTTDKNGIAGYELALNFNGVPCEIIPRSAAEMKSTARFQLVSVNDAEQRKNPARHLVVRKGSGWVLGPAGTRLLDLLTYTGS
jgi:murein DD-endopeptidase MepM/ murein hydrolase activator NlpD